MARIGLVLGAGGIAGHAFHAGVLRALAEVTGFDAREAEVIVGTSAGSHVGALLRGGISASDIACRYSDQPTSPACADALRRIGPAMDVPSPSIGSLLPSSPGLLARQISRPWAARPATVMTALLPRGNVSLDPLIVRLNWLHDGVWPRRALWLPAVRLDTGARVVFGQPGAPTTTVGSAVAASCAVPSWFRPVRIEGRRYVDGGVHSPTNADLLADLGLDLVIVSSPMSVTRAAFSPAALVAGRAATRARLGQEIRAIRRRGVETITFQPTADDLQAVGFSPMHPRVRVKAVQAAYTSTLRHLQNQAVTERLAPLLHDTGVSKAG